MRTMRRRGLMVLAPGMAGTLLIPGASGQGFSPAQRAEIIDILRGALRDDPSLLRDAQAALAAAAERERAGVERAAIDTERAALFGNPDDPVLGNPAGRVVIVEFADPRCGYCKQLHLARQELLRRNREVRVVMKDLAILGPLSTAAARVLLAAHRQGRYAALHDAIYRLREEPVDAVLRREAERAGLDWSRLRREADDPAIARHLAGNLRLASALRVEGTPALVIGDTLVAGAVTLPELERRVEAADGR